jgi:hypothetical protein
MSYREVAKTLSFGTPYRRGYFDVMKNKTPLLALTEAVFSDELPILNEDAVNAWLRGYEQGNSCRALTKRLSHE